MGRLRGAKLVPPDIALVNIYAKSRRIWDNIVAAIKRNLDREDLGGIKSKLFDRRAATLKPREIWHSCRKMDARRGAYGS